METNRTPTATRSVVRFITETKTTDREVRKGKKSNTSRRNSEMIRGFTVLKKQDLLCTIRKNVLFILYKNFREAGN